MANFFAKYSAFFAVAAILSAATLRRSSRGGQSNAVSNDDKCNIEEIQIEDILGFWFDGDLQENYRQKWFPSHSSERQHVADSNVNDRYGYLLDKAINGDLDHWPKVFGPRGAAALIILLDQFSRHIYRYHGKVGDERQSLLDVTGRKAVQISEQIVHSGAGKKLMSAPFEVFSLMPLRHLPTKDRLRLVMAEVDARIDQHQKEADLLQKFRKTTLRKLQTLECQAEEGSEILEHFPFKADETSMPSNKLCKTVDDFLQKHFGMGRDIGMTTETNNKEEEEEKEHLKSVLAVSLSGGVDSMVVAKILVHLKAKYHFDVVGIHIDYDNRTESGREADFVEQWCNNQGIMFRKRIIDEVTRGVTDRDAYERIARDLRYGTYRAVEAELGCRGVFFGHHRGDVQENVLSNIMHRASLLNMAGMGPSSKVNGVTVYRPLLDHDKDAIFEFAHQYGVPYFKDTTPTWSTRGKTRNHLVPLLKEIHGEGCLTNLSLLAAESEELNRMVQASTFGPFFRSVTYGPLGCRFDCMPWQDQSHFFWKEALKGVMHAMGMAQLREKAIGVLRKRLGQHARAAGGRGRGEGGSRPGWLELRRGFPTYFEHGNLFIFREGMLKILEEDKPWVPNGTTICLNTPFMLGPWEVCVVGTTDEGIEKVVGKSCSEKKDVPVGGIPLSTSSKTLDRIPAFESMEQLFGQSGFSYFLAVEKVQTKEDSLTFEFQSLAKIKPFGQVDSKFRKKFPVVVSRLTARPTSEKEQHLLEHSSTATEQSTQNHDDGKGGVPERIFCYFKVSYSVVRSTTVNKDVVAT